MNAMYLRLKSLYINGRLTLAELDNAVKLNWITSGQKTEIIKSK